MPLALTAIVLFLAPLLAAMPEEPIWSLIFSASVIATGIFSYRSFRSRDLTRTSRCVLLLGGTAVISLAAHWLFWYHGSPTYLNTMLKGTIFWLACITAYTTAASDRSRPGLYVKIIALIAGSSCAAGYGLQDYLLHLRYGQGQWREYGTSLPDFFAGHLLMTVPTTLALFIGAKDGKGRLFWLLYLFALLVQLAAIPTTGSRFAFISLPIGIAVFFGCLAFARSRGMVLGKAPRTRLIALAVLTLLGGAVVAKPILSRLQTSTLKSQAHSGDFRIWTWHGTIKLIGSSPIVGAGPGMFTEAYPKRSIVGFTEHAHDSYLQTAGDIGVPGLLSLLAGFAFALCTGFGALSMNVVSQIASPSINQKKSKAIAPSEQSNELADNVYLTNDRFLVAGLIGSIVAALIQNVVDSDWYVFATGITLFSILGIVIALSPTKSGANDRGKQRDEPVVKTFLVVAAALSLLLATAQVTHDSGSYATALQLNPLNSRYADDYALKVALPAGDVAGAQESLTTATKLSPDGFSFERLGSFYEAAKQYRKAADAWNEALNYDPHSVSILTSLALLYESTGQPEQALRYYQRIVDIETTPYGTVRAIPEVSETKFADADAAVGDSLLAEHQPAKAVPYYLRAQADCEEYSSAGGAANGMRAAMNHGVVDTDLDTHMRALYIRVEKNLAISYADNGSDDLAAAEKAHLNEELKTFPGT